MTLVYPEYIHQIFINEDDTIPEFPLVIQENIRSVQVWYPKAKYKLWVRAELEAFIGENFEAEVLQCFQLLEPYAYKADLARYCLLYFFGGLYIDVGLRLLQPLDPPINYGFIGFQDVQNSTHIWTSVINGLIWAQPKREEFFVAINMVVKNCQNRYYGNDPLSPTGPALLGWAITKTMAQKPYLTQEEFWIGYMKHVVGEKHVIVTPRNEIVAYKPQHIALGAVQKLLKTNSYGEIWRTRQVYKEDNNRWQWDYTDTAITISESSNRTLQAIEWSKAGIICYGPYILLQTGRYSLKIQLDYEELEGIEVEITANCGEILIFREYKHPNENKEIVLDFSINKPSSQIEFKLYSMADKLGRLLGYELHKQVVES